MQSNVRDAALELGFVDAQPATGHPFDVWRSRLAGGQLQSLVYDPTNTTGWPLEEITIWAAIAPTPPLKGWPENGGEIGGFYMCSQTRRARHAAWEEAATALGYEIKQGAISVGANIRGILKPRPCSELTYR